MAHGRAAGELTGRFFAAVVVKGVLNAPGAGGTDALIDLQGAPEVRGGFGRVLVEKAAADSFQRACFLKGAPSSRAMASA